MADKSIRNVNHKTAVHQASVMLMNSPMPKLTHSAMVSVWLLQCKKQVPVGQGIIDWKEFFAAAKSGGVKNFFVEMDLDKFKDSAT